jgi:hypothetical protein
MAHVHALDYRRTDLRTNVLANPFWISSAVVDVVAAEDLAAMLFSFPTHGRVTVVHAVVVQIVTACAGGTISGTLGVGTLATNDVTTAGELETVDVDDFVQTAAVTWGTIGYYPYSTSDFLTAMAAGTLTGPTIIIGHDTTVPTVALYMASDTTATEGHVAVHMLISNIPGF